jgi:CDP-6-deoxy-D-xylo-4-hexulose-3-dehydrase
MSEDMRAEIVRMAREYFNSRPVPAFVPGETYIPPSGKVLDADDCGS